MVIGRFGCCRYASGARVGPVRRPRRLSTSGRWNGAGLQLQGSAADVSCVDLFINVLGLLGSFGFVAVMLYVRAQAKARGQQRKSPSPVASRHPIEQRPGFSLDDLHTRLDQAYADAGKTRADFSVLADFARDHGYSKPPVTAEWEGIHESDGGPPDMVEHLAGYWFRADGESNAEQGIEAFVERVAPAMAQVDLPIEQIVADYSNDSRSCTLTCNGKATEVFRAEDWPGHRALATERPMSLLNLLLVEANNSYRWYGRCVGGNEGTVVLLPQDLGDLAVSHSLDLVSFPATTHGDPSRR